MTVRDLKDLLDDYNDDSIIVMQAGNSRYVDSIYGIEEKEVFAFYGSDYEALVLVADEQVGGV